MLYYSRIVTKHTFEVVSSDESLQLRHEQPEVEVSLRVRRGGGEESLRPGVEP